MADLSVVVWAVAYLSGLVVGSIAGYFPVTAGLLVTAGTLIGIKWMRTNGNRNWTLILTVILFVFGAARMIGSPARSESNSLKPYVGSGAAWFRGRIDSPPGHRPGRTEDEGISTQALLHLESIRIGESHESVRGKIRLTVHGFDPALGYGDVIEIFSGIKPITGFENPGGFDYPRHVANRDILARAVVGRPEHLRILGNEGIPILRRIYQWREDIRNAMAHSLSPQAASILQAMIIGESGFITDRMRDMFMDSGTVHLLSISGSHLGLLALIVFGSSIGFIRYLPPAWLLHLGRIAEPRRLAAIATLASVVFYTLLSGSQIATVRSLIMISIYLGGIWLARDHDPLRSLSMAALAVTLADPRTIFDISFHLSYGAVLAIVLALRMRPRAIRSVPPSRGAMLFGKVRLTILMTTAAAAGTAPIVAHHFNQISWAGLLANPVVMPLVGCVIVPAGLFGAVWVIATGSETFPWPVLHDRSVGLMSGLASFFSTLPGAAVHTASPPATVIFLWCSALGILSARSMRISRRIGIAILGLSLTLPWILGAGSIGNGGKLQVTFLDVGQGDAALIEFPGGRTMLIDGGARYGSFDVGRFAVAPYLWDRGIRSIDRVVMSHPQADHAGGLDYILRNFKVGEVWTNGVRKDADFDRRIVKSAREKGVRMKTVHRDMPPIRIGRTAVRILHPPPSRGSLGNNDLSLVLQISYGRSSLLFPGDLEAVGEKDLVRSAASLRSSVLKVPHHGSRSSIDPEFLMQVSPEVAVVSAGKENRYGHPSPETLEAYRLLGSRVYRTDRDGAVLVATNGRAMEISTFREYELSGVSRDRNMWAKEWRNWKKLVRVWTGANPA